MAKTKTLKTAGITETYEPLSGTEEVRFPFWTGRVLMIKKFTEIKTTIDQINKACKDDANDIDYDTERAGVYILLGEENDKQLAYIGRADGSDSDDGDGIGKRLLHHSRIKDKEWCERAILIVETGKVLTPTYVKYLESRLIQIANDVGKVPLQNMQIPKLPQLTNAHSKMIKDDFLEKLFVILDRLHVDIFTGWQNCISKQESEISPVDEKLISSDIPIFELISKHADHYKANLRYEVEGKDEKFTVLKGSYARGEWTGNVDYGRDKDKINSLKLDGILKETPDKRWRFEKDYSFNYISAAAKVIVGRNANGYTEWKVKGENKTFREWKAEVTIKVGSI